MISCNKSRVTQIKKLQRENEKNTEDPVSSITGSNVPSDFTQMEDLTIVNRHRIQIKIKGKEMRNLR
jgi:hypothetical protein